MTAGEPEGDDVKRQGDARADDSPPENSVEEWRDTAEDAVGSGPLLRTVGHTASMQKRVLYGIGGVFALTLLLLVAAVSFGGITEEFALELGRLVFPAALAAGATVVGTLFVGGDRRGRDL
ncbi:hypothetical protein JOF56_001879 [Kibdelosporangium banguiense]|uniref:Uncharacterized protein n=1 Tax=Kibdelosporangium banguiense TaxID=1365924 RepID=A0ABS4TAP1_9PSEU|nr:hypothetical protein [Kibdelosporangium banguiense]MBP2321494.1 hypothetical protein [Kibdelosporangium banguiense]